MNRFNNYVGALAVFIIALILLAFMTSCRSVKKSQHTTTAEVTKVATKDSVVTRETSTKSEATARLIKELTTDSSKTRKVIKTTIIERPVFDSSGKLKSADKVTQTEQLEEKQAATSDSKTDSTDLKKNESLEKLHAFVHGKDSTFSKLEVVDKKKQVHDYTWFWFVLALAGAGLCWYKRGWIIEKTAKLFA